MDLQKQTELRQQQSELRASDADRDRIADILREALAEGRLTAEEHAERVEEVYRARTVGELEPLVRDLPAAHPLRATPAYAPAPNRPTAGAIPVEPDENVVAVFSAAMRKGRWRAGRRMHAYAIFGSVEIDLSEAIFEYQQVVIKVISVFGNVEIRVPENVSLRGTGGGVLGNFEVSTLDSGDADAPVVYVDGLAILGNVEARPKRGKLVADILDRVSDRVTRKLDHGLRKHLDR
ncbi:hypothetical protein AQJ43_02095 [Streptomyces avermitilis]|uniref:Uncharacterized protein n=2 Tax=Streptomyces avermitilis TaxID=33903 RepID=Q82IE1_STRAW|nr:DUF1707 domain-containing protein [Streptomyces avermitilis]MYS98814.1 DUF1707 domain-containing protein [Streptomyces sp. SID5469]KUN56424.1 hypothetical protein AQJ43_02095 [Streptomyces avermitilis]OOV32851.1 hypothetical protein SM007_08700 [Streptomyces avermitilis]BAC70928.1 hypothetical protein SAVERM_3217 [Streptomyces avermitilis MA-4680 = NBRC 14893]BBJ51082.1 hypothetical protein SAVMC3_37110 [Streptomyces avermitilis]